MKAGLNRALEIVEKLPYAATRSAVVVRAGGTSELRIEASRGLTAEEQRAFLRIEDGLDRPGDGERQAGGGSKSGRRNRSFSSRAAPHAISQSSARTLRSSACPLIIDRATSGALGVDMRYEKNRDYDHILGFLSLVASMMSQALRIAHLADAETHPSAGGPAPHREQPREQAEEQHDFSNLIGNSGPMQQVYEQIGKVARSNATVMVRGESGTGKELIAHAIHYNSLRKSGPFIKVNCAALPDTLIESELFGYEKGAFTGAQAQKKGRFELAECGTLFLDEIGEVNAATAVKLLRVLQEREFERVGGTRTVKADVRLIVATNKDLEKAILAGTFREDLFYRLNVFSIFLPPLRERKPDVLLLADHFLDVYNSAHGKNIKRISTPAIDMLMSYHWPGNVRELSNTIERAVLICDEHVIHGYHLPPTLQTAEATGTVLNVSLLQSVEAYEKELIHDTL